MKYLPDITFREGMRISVSLGTAIFIFMLGTYLASALTSRIIGGPVDDRGFSLAIVAPDFWSVKHTHTRDVGIKPAESPRNTADSDAERALKATQWMVFQELQNTIRNSLPTAVASTDPRNQRNMESVTLVAKRNGTSAFYGNGEIVYDELKGDVEKMLKARLAQTQESLQGDYQRQLLDENMQLKADDNAAIALAATNRDVIKNLHESVRHMILDPLGTDGVMEIAQEKRTPANRATSAIGNTRSFTRVSWNSTDE